MKKKVMKNGTDHPGSEIQKSHNYSVTPVKINK